jgi:hypothetical protein
MTRRQTLKSAWADYWADDETRPPINHYFECGFDAAWDALLSEIGPLVAELRKPSELKQSGVTVRLHHLDAIKLLRELTQEPGEG